MNIYTFKLTKKHIVAGILLIAALVALLILLAPSGSASAASTVKIKTQDDCVRWLAELGYQVSGEGVQSRQVTIPKTFDAVYETYNEMQRECGFDLLDYAGKKVTLTTYRVTNYPYDEPVLLDVLVYKHKVVGGAVYTAAVDGFMHGLKPLEEKSE
ncbi:MAG: DUF4830 domain-containing protein [Clostridia bacterium]|nr:DUF4830 domain-containing protein [Clostridia bacterium]